MSIHDNETNELCGSSSALDEPCDPLNAKSVDDIILEKAFATPAPASVPSAIGPGLNPALIHVAPDGNDSADGLTWTTAVKTGYVGLEKLFAVGGGYLNVANGTTWGGPVPGQGIWVRGDGADVPGFLAVKPCIIQGFGSGVGIQVSFQSPGAAVIYGGSNLPSDYRNKPGYWAVNMGEIVQLRNIRLKPTPGREDGEEGLYQGFRIGWDFNRNASDGSIQYLTITSSSRSGPAGAGSTVHTVTLPTGVAIQSATRASSVVTVTIPRPAGAAKYPPWVDGTNVWIESSDPANFPSVAAVVTSPAADADDSSYWSFSYAQTGDDHTTPNMGVVRSIIANPDDYIDLESTSDQFPSTRYRVTQTAILDSTTGTITVTDIYGGFTPQGGNIIAAAAGPIASIGRLAHEERGFNRCHQPNLYNVYNHSPQGDEKVFRIGPNIDLGGNLAQSAIIDTCDLEGYFPVPSHNIPVDLARISGVHCYGSKLASGSLVLRKCAGSQVCIYAEVGQTSAEVVIDLLADTNSGYPPPIYVIIGGDSVTVVVKRAILADPALGYTGGSPIITGVPPLQISGVALETSNAGPGPGMGLRSNWSTIGQIATSPWVGLRVGTWADLKITGKHPAAWRQLSPTYARFKNLIDAPSAWSPVAPDQGHTDPMGSSLAVRYDDTIHYITNSGGFIRAAAPDPDTFFEAGGHYVICGWINYQAGQFSGVGLFSFLSGGDLIWESDGPSFTKSAPFVGDGWQFVAFSEKLISGSPSQSYSLYVYGPEPGTGKVADYFGVGAFWIPPTISDNDVMEFIGTLKAQPLYLRPGQVGTFEGQRFIAHGGLAVDPSNISAPSNALAVAQKWEPRYSPDGTVQGYEALYDSPGAGGSLIASKSGKNLINADITRNPASEGASLYTLADGSLTANHALTLGIGGSPITGSVVAVLRLDRTANTYAVKDDAGTTLFTFAASPTMAQIASFSFDGTHFKFRDFRYVETTPPSHLKVWLRADLLDVTLVSGAVSVWHDRSGNGNDVSQSNASIRPVWAAGVIGNNPGIRFDPNTLLHATASPLGVGEDRTVVVITKKSGENGGIVVMFRDAAPGFVVECPNFIVGGRRILYEDGTSTDVYIPDATLPSPLVYETYGKVGFAPTIYFNAAVQTLTTGFGSGLVQVDSGTDGFTIGNNPAGNTFFYGYICEVLIYDHVLTAAETADVRKYLQAKYLIDLGAP